jgi:hypothetical protein
MNLKEGKQPLHQGFLRLYKSHHVKLLYAFGASVSDRFKEDTSDTECLLSEALKILFSAEGGSPNKSCIAYRT